MVFGKPSISKIQNTTDAANKQACLSQILKISDYRAKNMIRLSGRAKTRLESGTRGGIRTHDPRFRRPMLYPAELLSHNRILNILQCSISQRQIITWTHKLVVFVQIGLIIKILLIEWRSNQI